MAKRSVFSRNLLALGVAALMAGCGGGSGSGTGLIPGTGGQEAPSNPGEVVMAGEVRGSVMTDRPIVGAQVSLRTPDGKALAGMAITDAEGNFSLRTTDARSQMQIVATGGTTPEGQALLGTLSAFIGDFESEIDTPLTPVTTLADRIRIAADGDAEWGEMRAANYLALPPAVSIETDFRDGISFNSEKFMRLADLQGLDNLLNTMAAEAVERPDLQRSFANQELVGNRGNLQGTAADFSADAEYLMTGFLQKALNYIPGGDVFGGLLLEKIFGGGGQQDDMAIQFEVVNKKLDEIKKTVDDIDVKVTKIMADIRTAPLDIHVNNIITVWVELYNAEKFYAKQPEELLKRYGEILNGSQMQAIYNERLRISNTLEGRVAPGKHPVRLYAEYFQAQKFYSEIKRKEYETYLSFYNARDAQAYILLALREIWNKQSTELKIRQKEFGERTYPNWKPKALPDANIYYDVKNSTAWYFAKGEFTIQEVTMNDFYHDRCYAADFDAPCYNYRPQGDRPAGNRMSDQIKTAILPDAINALGKWYIPSEDRMNATGRVARDIESAGVGPILVKSLGKDREGEEVWTIDPERRQGDYYLSRDDFRMMVKTMNFSNGSRHGTVIFEHQWPTNARRRVLAFHVLADKDREVFPWNTKW